MSNQQIAQIFRNEALNCRESRESNHEAYAAAFKVCEIVLKHMAAQIENVGQRSKACDDIDWPDTLSSALGGPDAHVLDVAATAYVEKLERERAELQAHCERLLSALREIKDLEVDEGWSVNAYKIADAAIYRRRRTGRCE